MYLLIKSWLKALESYKSLSDFKLKIHGNRICKRVIHSLRDINKFQEFMFSAEKSLYFYGLDIFQGS